MRIGVVIILMMQWLLIGVEIGINIMKQEIKSLGKLTDELEKKYGQWCVMCCIAVIVLMFISFLF